MNEGEPDNGWWLPLAIVVIIAVVSLITLVMIEREKEKIEDRVGVYVPL